MTRVKHVRKTTQNKGLRAVFRDTGRVARENWRFANPPMVAVGPLGL